MIALHMPTAALEWLKRAFSEIFRQLRWSFCRR